METIVLQIEENDFDAGIEKAVEVLRKGGIIIYPTETSYGLGVKANDKKAVRKVHKVKRQPKDKAISIIGHNTEVLGEFARIGEKTRALVGKFMPGPLTLVVEKRESVPDVLSRKGIAFRISANRIAFGLCRKLGTAITATSANIHGKEPVYSGKEAIEEFSGMVDLIIDAGKLPKIKASTIYDVDSGKVLRRGPVKEKEIESVVND